MPLSIEKSRIFQSESTLYPINSVYETFEEFKPACRIFFRNRKKYLPELQMLLTDDMPGDEDNLT
jgi:hypothetical protein